MNTSPASAPPSAAVTAGAVVAAWAVTRRYGEQVGWVPRELAAELAAELDAGERWSALVLREQRRSPRDPRHGLTMLLAPAEELKLRVTPSR